MVAEALGTPRHHLFPLALWHLLSLDAPTVATLWTVFAARVLHQTLPATLPVIMFVAVWLLYATDRLLDTRAGSRMPRVTARSRRAGAEIATYLDPSENLQTRHHFHRHHRKPFRLAILLAAATLTLLIPALPASLLRLYLPLAVLLAAWFALIHLTRLPLPKELIPGLFFAAAVFIPTPHAILPATLFAALCTLNCLYIHAWEHPSASRVPHPHYRFIVMRVGLGRRPTSPTRGPTALTDLGTTTPATRLALRHLPQLAFALVLLPLAHPSPTAIATSLSAVALLALNYYRYNLSPTALRAAADLALLTPLLLLPFLP